MEKVKASKKIVPVDRMGPDFLRMKERRWDLNLWLVDGTNHGGHFPISVSTNNRGHRSEARTRARGKERRERRSGGEERKGRGGGREGAQLPWPAHFPPKIHGVRQRKDGDGRILGGSPMAIM